MSGYNPTKRELAMMYAVLLAYVGIIAFALWLHITIIRYVARQELNREACAETCR